MFCQIKKDIVRCKVFPAIFKWHYDCGWGNVWKDKFGIRVCCVNIQYLFVAFKVLNLQMSDGAQGDAHTDDTKLHGKPDKTLRFSLCSDNLEGISEGWSAVASHVTHNMMQPQMGKIVDVKKQV